MCICSLPCWFQNCGNKTNWIFQICKPSPSSCLVCLSGHRTTVNSALAPVGSTNCATCGRAPSVPWTSGPNSALSTTANPSGAGTTSGSPTHKWMVSWLDPEWTESVHPCGTLIFYVWFAPRILWIHFSYIHPWKQWNIYGVGYFVIQRSYL